MIRKGNGDYGGDIGEGGGVVVGGREKSKLMFWSGCWMDNTLDRRGGVE